MSNVCCRNARKIRQKHKIFKKPNNPCAAENQIILNFGISPILAIRFLRFFFETTKPGAFFTEFFVRFRTKMAKQLEPVFPAAFSV